MVINHPGIHSRPSGGYRAAVRGVWGWRRAGYFLSKGSFDFDLGGVEAGRAAAGLGYGRSITFVGQSLSKVKSDLAFLS